MMNDSEMLAIARGALEALELYARHLLALWETQNLRYQNRWFLAWQQANIVVNALDAIRGHGTEEMSGAWISTEARLPEELQDVLLYSVDHGITVGVRAYNDSWSTTWWGYTEISWFSHWMPLPEPPAERRGHEESEEE